MMCAETVHEIVVERHLGFQAFDTLPQALFAIGKRMVVHKAEIRRSILLSVYQDISTSLSLITPVGDNEMMGKSVI